MLVRYRILDRTGLYGEAAAGTYYPARKATADFSKIKIIFLGSPCTIFPKASQTANKSASVVLKGESFLIKLTRFAC
jgi:hypothetical protein